MDTGTGYYNISSSPYKYKAIRDYDGSPMKYNKYN
jgi:hypothetical protein